MYVIFDPHGKVDLLNSIISRLGTDKLIISVGDLGWGFIKIPHFPQNFKSLRGNHDSPNEAWNHPNYIGDYGYFVPNEKHVYRDTNPPFFFVSGAASIDIAYRKAGRDWWYNEELSIESFDRCVELYRKIKPDIVITHDAPRSAYPSLGIDKIFQDVSHRTIDYLNRMLNIHQPTWWIFGHHHKRFVGKIEGCETTFVCGDELDAWNTVKQEFV